MTGSCSSLWFPICARYDLQPKASCMIKTAGAVEVDFFTDSLDINYWTLQEANVVTRTYADGTTAPGEVGDETNSDYTVSTSTQCTITNLA